MAGISSRLRYDNCEYQNRLSITEGTGKYKISTDIISQNKLCTPTSRPANSKVGYASPNEYNNINILTDIESHLKNLDVSLNDCNEGNTLEERGLKGKDIIKDFLPSLRITIVYKPGFSHAEKSACE